MCGRACSETASVNNKVWAGLELMCTWCPAGVVCDLPIRECVSENGHVSVLSLCPDGGGRGTCSGSVLVAPFRVYIIIIIIIIIIIFRWVATVGSTGYGRPHRRVRIDA